MSETTINFEKIPEALRKRDQWVLWRYEARTTKGGASKPTKVPKQAVGRNAKSNDPSTWCSFEVAKDAFLRGGFDGVGFCLKNDDGLCCVDLDACRDPASGQFSEWSAKLLKQSTTYAEISPSLTGIKLFCEGVPPFKPGSKKVHGAEPINGKAPGVEVFHGESARYLCITGLRVKGRTAEPTDETELLRHLAETYWKDTGGDDEGAEDKPTKRGRKKRPARPYNPAEWTPAAKRRRFDQYLKTHHVPEAIEGDHGSDKTFHFACLVVEHDLDDRMGVMQEYNRQCVPEWNDADLQRKLKDAEERTTPGSKLGVPPAKRTAGDLRPTILIDTDEERVNAEALEALGKHPDVHANGGELVHVVEASDGSVRIVPLRDGLLQEYLAATAFYVQLVSGDDGVEERPMHPPSWTVKALSQRGNYPGVRPLVGVVYHPVFRPDGTLATARGYDPATALYIACDLQTAVPEFPTEQDADAAVATLFDVVVDFPFVERSHFAAWVAGLITPLCRAMFDDVAPGFHVEGNTPGVGKGLCLEVQSAIRNGRSVGVSSYSDEDELRKLVTSALRTGKTELHLDNITGKFGDGTLNRLLTGRIWEDRTLGTNDAVSYPNRMTLYSTGNNCLFDDDSTRRFNVIRLQTSLEHPEDRNDFQHANLLDHVREHRAELLTAALTIMRAFVVAGRPPQEMKPWGGFESWSAVVRGAVIFAGCADPALTRVELQNQSGTNNAAAKLFAEELHRLCAAKYPHGLNARDIIAEISDDLRSTLEQLVYRGELTSKSLGTWIRRFKNRVVGDFVIKTADEKGVARVPVGLDPRQECIRCRECTNSHPYTGA